MAVKLKFPIPFVTKENRVDQPKRLRETVCTNARNAQRRQKYYDCRHHKSFLLALEDYVWVKGGSNPPGLGRKYYTKYVRPYEII